MSICVHGLGYIGLATASLFATNGHTVSGYDVDEDLRERLRAGEPDATEPELYSFIRSALDDGLTISDECVEADFHFICVPTPYDHAEDRAGLTAVEAAAETISQNVREGDTVVLESTVPPGTTRERVAPILRQSGLEPGVDFGLGYTPETVMPGNTVTELQTNDRIVGGIGQVSTDAVTSLFAPLIEGEIHEAPSATVAEFVKLAQNAFRDTNIAYANMLALVAADYDVDVRTAIELANNHPRVDILDPGPGVGGHCLPVDPLFLAEKSDETSLIEASREVNDRMPRYVVELLEDELGSLDGTAVTILGIAYKGNVSDTRNSPGLEISKYLGASVAVPRSIADGGQDSGVVDVRLCDPNVADDSFDLLSIPDALRGADAAIVASAHDEFAELNPELVGLLMSERLVVDPLNLLDADEWRDAGFDIIDL